MKTTFISSLAVSTATRSHTLRMQSELTKLEKEVVSGRVYDAGIHLGSRTGQSISLERDIARLQGIIESNSLAASRLAATQAGLATIGEQANKLLTLTIPATGDAVRPEIAIAAARQMLGEMTGVLNTTFNGESLFAGVNTDVRPINDFFATPSPARTAMETLFQTHFGFAYTDPAAQAIDNASMSTFLTTVLEPHFLGAGWADWSNATDETITARITLTETVPASVSANTEGVRRLAMAAAAIAVFFEGEIDQPARDAILEFGTAQTVQAITRVSQVQAQAGIVENRISAADERLDIQIGIFRTQNSELVEVDPYEASSRVSLLLAQIETAYTLTSRIRALSLVKYLP